MDIGLDVTCRNCGAAIVDSDLFCPRCGNGQPEALAQPRTPVHEVVDPKAVLPLLSTKPSPASLTGFFVTLGVLAAATLPVFFIRAVFFGPDDVVNRYFAALTRRDAAAAIGVFEPGARPDPDGLFSNAALAGDGYLPPTDVRIVSLETSGDTSTAVVTYQVAGRPVTNALVVHRGRATNLFERWHLRTGLQSLAVVVGGAGVYQVGGAQLSLGGGGDGSIAALPGGYVIRLAENPLLSSDTVTVVTDASQKAQVVAVSVKASAVTEIEKQMQTLIEACAKSTDARPAGCPFGVSTSYYDPPIRWQVVSYPKLTAKLGQEGALVVSSTADGTVRVTGGPGSYYTAPSTMSYRVSGTAEATAGGVRFVPDVYQ